MDIEKGRSRKRWRGKEGEIRAKGGKEGIRDFVQQSEKEGAIRVKKREG